MKTIPKKQTFSWGYTIPWAKFSTHLSEILHIHTQQKYPWQYDSSKFQALHCLFGSLLIETAAGIEKIWPGETYTLDPEVLSIKAGHEDAEVLFTSTTV
ncbi:MAG: hypothetical protein KatS3mg087_0696 [Patescibacteria group bacterium]|nr:MAG: hypothetical protein KatS3mg087_0696 [Patescibacteria group bacterium]